MRILDVPEEITKRLALKNAQGALIAQTVDAGPAAPAGVKKGDVILSFDGKPVSTSRSLQRLVADAGIDREVEALIWRDGKEIRTEDQVGRLEEAQASDPAKPADKKPEPPPAATGQVLGLDVAPLNADTRSRFKIDPTLEGGVVVVAVRRNSPLKDENIRTGEIIVELASRKCRARGADGPAGRAQEGRPDERAGADLERRRRDALSASARRVNGRNYAANSSLR